jgi:hypothetical protein
MIGIYPSNLSGNMESGGSVIYRTRIEARSPKMNDFYIKYDAKRQNTKEGLKRMLEWKQS